MTALHTATASANAAGFAAALDGRDEDFEVVVAGVELVVAGVELVVAAVVLTLWLLEVELPPPPQPAIITPLSAANTSNLGLVMDVPLIEKDARRQLDGRTTGVCPGNATCAHGYTPCEQRPPGAAGRGQRRRTRGDN
jgi:hypothetical protein